MRTQQCIGHRHRDCGGTVNRGTTNAPRLMDCSCACHRPRSAARPAMRGTARRWVLERDGYRCRANIEGVCQGSPDHVHHIVPRGRGGTDDDIGLLVTVCFACHNWVHANPDAATERGLLRSLNTDPEV